MQKVVKHLRSLGWIEPYEIPVESYDEWNDWENVPVGVKVFDHHPYSTNTYGVHNAWRKTEGGGLEIWYVDGAGPFPASHTDAELADLGPFVRADA